MPPPAKPRKTRPVADVVRHILSAIEQIERFTAGMTLDQFRADDRTIRATERCLEIISEASRDIPDEIKNRFPHIRWRAMADAGNLYRHGYEHISTPILWQTILDDVPPLKDVVVAVGEELRQGGGVTK